MPGVIFIVTFTDFGDFSLEWSVLYGEGVTTSSAGVVTFAVVSGGGGGDVVVVLVVVVLFVVVLLIVVLLVVVLLVVVLVVGFTVVVSSADGSSIDSDSFEDSSLEVTSLELSSFDKISYVDLESVRVEGGGKVGGGVVGGRMQYTVTLTAATPASAPVRCTRADCVSVSDTSGAESPSHTRMRTPVTCASAHGGGICTTRKLISQHCFNRWLEPTRGTLIFIFK